MQLAISGLARAAATITLAVMAQSMKRLMPSQWVRSARITPLAAVRRRKAVTCGFQRRTLSDSGRSAGFPELSTSAGSRTPADEVTEHPVRLAGNPGQGQ